MREGSKPSRARRRRSRAIALALASLGILAVLWGVLDPLSHDGSARSTTSGLVTPAEPIAYQWQPQGPADPSIPLPAYASRSGVEPLYRFALAHPEVLTYIPCTCGCRGEGHRSNWNCYVRGVTPQGKVVFDDMAPT